MANILQINKGSTAATLIVIPARMASKRFPSKPMAKICGITMIERVWKIALAVDRDADVVVATDDETLKIYLESRGIQVVMTSTECRTGMDRAAETGQILKGKYDVIVTLQGDAVLTPPWVVEAVIDQMQDQQVEIATPMVRLTGESLDQFLRLKRAGSSTGTTVTFDKNKNAMYFSKTIIPHTRDRGAEILVYRHIGLYGYRRDTLNKLASLPQSVFEKIENLEQLRALENEIAIRMVEVDYRGRTHASVDNPEDVKIVEEIVNREGEII